MWKLVRTAAAAALLLLAAVPMGAAPFGVSDEEAEAILGSLAERYEVIATRHGYVLKPREEAPFTLIEVEDKTVLLDGTALEPVALAERLGDEDAALLWALAGESKTGELLQAERERREEERGQDLEAAAALREPREERREERRHRGKSHSGNRFSIGSALTIDEDEVVQDVVVIFGDLEVDGEVRGDAVVIGSIEIDGIVDGSVTAVGGSVSLGEEADVYGDVQAVGGRVYDPEGRIRGRITEEPLTPLGPVLRDWDRGWDWNWWDPPWLDLVNLLLNTMLLAVVVLLVLAVSRRRIDAVADRVRHEPWKAGLIGFIVEVLALPVLVVVSTVLVISVVGIPFFLLLIPLAILTAVVLFCMGYAGVALTIGEAFGRHTEPRRLSPFLAVLVGIAVIQVWQIFGETMTLVGGFVGFMAYLLVAVGFLFKYVVWTVGLGAVFLDRFSPVEPRGAYLAPPPLPDLEGDGPRNPPSPLS